MSTARINLKHPLVMGAVALGMLGVLALNISTFSSPRSRRQADRGYRVQEHPPVPADARPAVWQEPVPSRRAEAVVMTEDGARDPFFPARRQPGPVKVARSSGKGSRSARKKSPPAPLVCSAILAMGPHPMAIINGENLHIGDRIRDLTVRTINADGVVLADSKGGAVELPIGKQSSAAQPYRVVTRTRVPDEQGRTRLTDQ